MNEPEPIRSRLLQLRKENPRSRFVGLFRFYRNGSATRQMECVLCNELGPSWCAKWPKTVRSREWEGKHRQLHLAE